MKPIIAVCLAITFTALLSLECQCAQRFKDQEMMKRHHNHLIETDEQIKVHLIPHSHDDVGWLKTVDNYFYGGDTSTQWAGVQYTIDTVIEQLSANPSYKFTIVEVAFLYRWWNQATDKQRQQMKDLTQNGQLEFINGGWCMSDEATPYYEDVIDQMTIGHRWLKEVLGVVPTIAWHIDPFGHQASSASMFSRMGLNAFFFARIDYQDKENRLQKKSMETVWHPLQYNGQDNYIFTHVNYYHYSPPPGFCFDVLCRDEPIKDDPTLEDYNLDTKSDKLVQYFKSMSTHYRSNSLMHTLGEDFHFANARMWYKNIDKLIMYINSHPQYNMKIQYSTPGDYIKEINQQRNSYPSKSDDFFPYGDDVHDYWTGYFTSRTGVKGFVREFGRWIQAVRKHLAEVKISNRSNFIRNNPKLIEQSLWKVEMAQGILQHHDAVSGTEKQKVAYDYLNTALRAIRQFSQMYSQIQAQEIQLETGESIKAADIVYNIFWNETAEVTGLKSKLSAGKTVLVALYNPGSKGEYEIRINVPEKQIDITDLMNEKLGGDVVCANTYQMENCELIFNIHMNEGSNNYIKLTPSTTGSAKVVPLQEFRIVEKTKEFHITSDVTLKITRTSQQFDLTINGQTESFMLGYKYYDSYQGSGQKSGAYIFRPASDTPKTFSNIKKIYYADGTQNLMIVLEGDRTSTKLYFSKIANRIASHGFEIQTWIDTIPIDDNQGKQVTMNLKTNLANEKTFYTDSNGLEEQKRVLNYRPSWNFTETEQVAANYYPINSHIRIEDKGASKNLSLLTERSVGGSVINGGQIEVMIQRRLLMDDARGVGEPLNEIDSLTNKGITQSVRHFVVFGNKYREKQKINDQKVAISFVESGTGKFEKQNLMAAPIPVPENVKLYLRPFEDGSYWMRLHNMQQNAQATVNIPQGWTLEQLTLSANQPLSEWKKNQFKWKQDGQDSQSSVFEKAFSGYVEHKKKAVQSYFKSILDIEEGDETSPSAESSINLKAFDLRTFKMSKTSNSRQE